jgi:hypothetical protein
MVSANLYEAVFNASTTGNYLLSPTPDAIILAVNDAFLAASSRRREHLVGLSLFLAFPTWYAHKGIRGKAKSGESGLDVHA